MTARGPACIHLLLVHLLLTHCSTVKIAQAIKRRVGVPLHVKCDYMQFIGETIVMITLQIDL